jgi:hypothetical protein
MKKYIIEGQNVYLIENDLPKVLICIATSKERAMEIAATMEVIDNLKNK